MDLLKRELQKKRKAATQDLAGNSFVRRSELLEQKQLQKRRDEHHPKASQLASSALELTAASESDPSGGNPSAAAGNPSTSSSDELGLPRHEAIRRLRVLREPATLFGEGDVARVHRLNLALRSTAIDVHSGDYFHGDTTDEARKRHRAAGTRGDERRAGGGAGEGTVDEDVTVDDDADAEKDSSLMEAKFDELCKEDKILVFFKRLLDEWKQELDGMSELEKRTANGKRKVARFEQSARSLGPLFEFCRKKILPDDIRQALLDIVECCMRHDYLQAEEHYIKLAIGNAAWPIGVTMVGIHERSAREKISTNSIAHIMNDETTRRYLQSIKRLMTFCVPRSLTLP